MRFIHILLGTILTITTTSNCEYYNYAKAIGADADRIRAETKSFFSSLAFKGVVRKGTVCSECVPTQFKVVIEIAQLNNEIPFRFLAYPPSYTFEEKHLTLQVSKRVYLGLKEGDTIQKIADSRFLESKSQQFEVLSNDESYFTALD